MWQWLIFVCNQSLSLLAPPLRMWPIEAPGNEDSLLLLLINGALLLWSG